LGTIFRTAFTKEQLMTGDVAVVAGQPIRLGEYKVQAGELVSLGYANNESQEGAAGRIYVDIKNNAAVPGANIEGTVRFAIYSPQNRHMETLVEYRTETLRTDKANRTLQVPFPSSMFPFIREDRKLVLEFIADAAGTVGKANSTILMDMTTQTIIG
jgi:hypothetical protein